MTNFQTLFEEANSTLALIPERLGKSKIPEEQWRKYNQTTINALLADKGREVLSSVVSDLKTLEGRLSIAREETQKELEGKYRPLQNSSSTFDRQEGAYFEQRARDVIRSFGFKGFQGEMNYAFQRGLIDYATELATYSSYLNPANADEAAAIGSLVQRHKAALNVGELDKNLELVSKKLRTVSERRATIEKYGKDPSQAKDATEYMKLVSVGADSIVVQ